MASKLSETVGRKWLAFVMILVGIAFICLFQPGLIGKALDVGMVLGIVYLSWQGIDDIIENHYKYKTKELAYLKGKQESSV
jgi:hypothetical protein